jgi:hypothetical protein
MRLIKSKLGWVTFPQCPKSPWYALLFSSAHSLSVASLPRVRFAPLPKLFTRYPTMAASFVRAVSPSLAAIASTMALATDASSHNAQLARHSVILNTSSTVEIVTLIHSDYRGELADHFHALVALVTKVHNARSVLAGWKAHKVAGTLPPLLKGTVPKAQYSKEFAESDAAREANAVLSKARDDYTAASLTALIKGKQDEVAALEEELRPSTLYTKFLGIVKGHAVSVLAKNQAPILDNLGQVRGWEENPAALAIRDHLAEDLSVLIARTCSITFSSLEGKSLRFKKKKDTALAARVAAGDVEMADTDDPSSATLKATIDKAVANALKKAKVSPTPSNKRKRGVISNPGKTSPNAKRSKLMRDAKVRSCFHLTEESSVLIPLSDEVRQSHIHASDYQTPVRSTSVQTFTLPKFHRIRGQTSTRQAGPGPSQSQAAGPPPTKHSRSARRKNIARERTWPRQVEQRDDASVNVSGSIQRRVRTDRTDVSDGPYIVAGSSHLVRMHICKYPVPSSSSARAVVLGPQYKLNDPMNRHSIADPSKPGVFISQGDLWVSNPALIPDELLDLPLPQRVKYIVERMSLSMISELRYQQDVHTSPGVSLPKELAFQLSVGAKYMFHEPSNTSLFESAWNDFSRRLRWKMHFLFENPASQKPYDPDYDVRGQSHKQAPALPHFIELGLIKGRGFVYSTIRKVPDADLLGHTHKSLQPDVAKIREFLLDRQYVITGTDKNLGIAVSKRDWIIEKSQNILSDVNNYRRLTNDEALMFLSRKCEAMRELAEHAALYIDSREGTVADFMRSKITLPGTEHHIPPFYGIPKIHKQPVKMRPIIPCHSAIQNPAAKYVSKKLKPIIQSAPTIIHGTKDLAIKLSKLSINPKRKWYIVTGDVVAYYPNIPIQHCIDIVYNMYFEFYWNVRDHDDASNRRQQEFFKGCLEVGNTELITQYQNIIYEQLNGLAMGVASSPDLANLYGYYFERLRGVMNHNDIFYYGRYIDDCLAIVYAESESQALNTLQGLVQLDNCVITWDCSDSHQPFLDMTLYKDENNTLQHMPYRKNGNHQERIPWISAHPYDVKRGTFYGEMSRLATLSSQLEHYLAAMRGLVALYIRRGYPADEVHKWLYSNLSKRWNQRLDVHDPSARKADDADVLVLKTQYNLAWNYFNAHEMGDTIFGYWREWLVRADTGNFDTEFPAPDNRDLKLRGGEDWDLRKTNIFNSRVILSRKRTRNFLDLSNLWKKSVLHGIEGQALSGVIDRSLRRSNPERPVLSDLNALVVGRQLHVARDDQQDDDGLPEAGLSYRQNQIRYPSPTPGTSSWQSASLGTWGRGSRP